MKYAPYIFAVVVAIIIVTIIFREKAKLVAESVKQTIIPPEPVNVNEPILATGSMGDDVLDMAKALKKSIYIKPSSPSETIRLLTIANTFNDTAIHRLVIEYKKLAKESLYKDIDGEFLPQTDEDDKLLSRIKSLGLENI